MPRHDAVPGDETLSKREAIEFSGLDEKTFKNYFQVAGEFNCLEREGGRGRFYFSRRALEAWKASFDWRRVGLTLADSSLCLDFALASISEDMWYRTSGRARQREFGQKITNWVKGQLAEVAVKKFFEPSSASHRIGLRDTRGHRAPGHHQGHEGRRIQGAEGRGRNQGLKAEERLPRPGRKRDHLAGAEGPTTTSSAGLTSPTTIYSG